MNESILAIVSAVVIGLVVALAGFGAACALLLFKLQARTTTRRQLSAQGATTPSGDGIRVTYDDGPLPEISRMWRVK